MSADGRHDRKPAMTKVWILVIMTLFALMVNIRLPFSIRSTDENVTTGVGASADLTIRSADLNIPNASEADEAPLVATVAPTAVPEPSIAANTGRKATVMFAGDVLMHSYLINGGETEDATYDYDYLFQPISSFLSAADYAICNMEGTLGGEPYTGFPLFSAPDELARAMRVGGFKAATNANNHTIDRGHEGVIRTNNVLKEAGLDVLGTRAGEDADTWFIREINTINVGFSNYTYETARQDGSRSLNGIKMSADTEELIDSFSYEEPDFSADLAEMADRVTRMREAGAEAVVFILHWGTEYSSAENDYQVRIAGALADAGVDVIFSCGPHVIQPVKSVSSADGAHDTLVFYSGGNFVSDQLYSTAGNNGRAEDGLLMMAQFERDPSGDVRLSDSGYFLTYCYKNKYAEYKTHNSPIPVRAALADPDQFNSHEYGHLLEDSLTRSQIVMSENDVSGLRFRELSWPDEIEEDPFASSP